jgi:hypothetical protein
MDNTKQWSAADLLEIAELVKTHAWQYIWLTSTHDWVHDMMLHAD